MGKYDEAQRKHDAAVEALDEYADYAKKHGIKTETDEYLRRNREVNRTREDLPWYRRRR